MFLCLTRRTPFFRCNFCLARAFASESNPFHFSPIQRILQQQVDSKAEVLGWVRSKRVFKDFTFVTVNDGSNVNGIQCVIPSTQTHNITNGCSIQLLGVLKRPLSEKHHDGLELHCDSYKVIGTCDPEQYPLQKKFHTPEFLRTIPHIRPRSNLQGVVNRMRNTTIQSIHSTLQTNDFIQVMTPVITSNDCEGAGDMFSVAIASEKQIDLTHFFNSAAYLTVSGQLQAEMIAHAMTRVYSFGPTFRAENSNTSRHLCEFWMVEPEMCFADLQDLMNLGVKVVSEAAQKVLNRHESDIAFLQQRVEKSLLTQLHTMEDPQKYCHLTYTEAIDVLMRKGLHFEVPVKWGIDLQSEHERYLCEQYCNNQPLFLTHYPSEIKPFYMRESGDGKTVEAVDLLVPRVGEIIGGSVREERYDVLKEKMKQQGLLSEDVESGRSTKALDWYLDLRKYGTTPHGGWGLGLERVIELFTGVHNIRDIIPVPRVPGKEDTTKIGTFFVYRYLILLEYKEGLVLVITNCTTLSVLKRIMEGNSPKQLNSSSSILCPGHTRTVVGLDCSANTPDGVFFVSACIDGKPMLREAKTGNWVGSFVGHEGAVWSARINREATYVVTASADFTGKLWNATNGSLIHTFMQKHIVKAAAINNDSSLVAFGGKSKEVNIYSTSSFELVSTYVFDEEVAFIQFCPLPASPSLMICAGLSGKIVLFDTSSPTREQRSIQLTDIILDVNLCGDIIAIATCHGVRFLSWDLEMVNKKDYPFHINSCDVNHTQTRYLVSDMNIIYEVDYHTHDVLASYHGHHGTVHSLRYCSECDSFISGSDDSSIRLWMVDRN